MSKGAAVSGAARFDAGIYAEETALQGLRGVSRTAGERLYSIFRGVDPTPIGHWTASELRQYRAGEEATQAFGQVCQAADKAARDAIKAGLLRYAPAGVFPYRNNLSITAYTGEIVVDVDAPLDWLAPRIPDIVESLRACPHIADLSYSVGGRLHIRIRTGAPHSGLHAAAWRAARAAVANICPELDPWIDAGGKALSHSFICAAPCIWFNDDAAPLPLPADDDRPLRKLRERPETAPDFARAVVDALHRFAQDKPDALRAIWPVDDRNTWAGAAFAFADAVRLGVDERAAFFAFDAVSSCAHNYGQTESMWRDALRGNEKPDGATFGTLVYHARQLDILPGATRRKADTPESLRRNVWGEIEPEQLYVERYATEAGAGFFDFMARRPDGACVGVQAVTGIGKTTLVCRYGLAMGRPGAPFLIVLPLSMQRDSLRSALANDDKRQIAERYGLVPDEDGKLPGVCFLSLAEDTPEKQRAAGLETASLVVATYDAAAVYRGDTPCGAALDEVHEFVNAHDYRRPAVAGTMRLLSRIQDAGGRIILLSATMPQGLARAFALHSALAIVPETAAVPEIEFRVYQAWTEQIERKAGRQDVQRAAHVNLQAICDEIEARINTGTVQAVFLNARNALRSIQKELGRRGIIMPVIASDATGEDLEVMRYLEQHERLPEGVQVFGATSKLACGFNLYDEREAICHIVDNEMVAPVGRTTPEAAAQFIARLRDKAGLQVVWHTVPDRRDKAGKLRRGPTFDRAFDDAIRAADRMCDSANDARAGNAAGEILDLVTPANVLENKGKYYIDNVGALASALAAGNRLRPLADVAAALRLYIPQIRLRQTEVAGGADPVRESMKRDKKLQAGVAEAMIRWAVQYGQVGVRAVAFLAAEHTGKKGKQQYRRTFGKDLPGEENIDIIKKLPVEGPDKTETTVGELLASYGAALVLKFAHRTQALVQCGQDWETSAQVVTRKTHTSALGRLRARIACASCLCGYAADGVADGRGAAQMQEMKRLVMRIIRAHGDKDVTNKMAAETINANGGWFGERLTERRARELLFNFGHLHERNRKQKTCNRRRKFNIIAEPDLETLCRVDEHTQLNAEALRRAAEEALAFAARAYNITKAFFRQIRQSIKAGDAIRQAAARMAVTTVANATPDAGAPVPLYDGPLREATAPDPFPPPG